MAHIMHMIKVSRNSLTNSPCLWNTRAATQADRIWHVNILFLAQSEVCESSWVGSRKTLQRWTQLQYEGNKSRSQYQTHTQSVHFDNVLP